MGVWRASQDARKGGDSKALAVLRWLAAAMVVAALAACETGPLAYNRSTGAFELPFGPGTRSVGSNH